MSYDKSKVILALDNYSVPMAEEIIARWSSEVWGFKLNHNFYPYIGRNYNNIFCDCSCRFSKCQYITSH